MNTVSMLAGEIRLALETTHPALRKTILRKLPILVAAMVEAKTVNTTRLAAVLPLATKRMDMRLQWIARLLENRLLVSRKIIEPFARRVVQQAVEQESVLVLRLIQETLLDRFHIVMVNVIRGTQTVPLLWRVETSTEDRMTQRLSEQVLSWIPEKTTMRWWVDPRSASEGSPQGIDEIFSGVTAQGMPLTKTHLHDATRIDHLVLVMVLTLYWHNRCLSSQPLAASAESSCGFDFRRSTST